MEVFKEQGNDTEVLRLIWMISILSNLEVIGYLFMYKCFKLKVITEQIRAFVKKIIENKSYWMIYYNLNHVFEKREVPTVEVSYKKLWEILIDKDMKTKDLQAASGISWASVTKLSKGETVSMEVLMKLCEKLECDISDVCEFVKK